MPGPRDPRYAPRPVVARSAAPVMPPAQRAVSSIEAPATAPRRKPDPNPMRLMLGFAGIAAVSALTAAMVPSIAPAPVDGSDAVDAAATDPAADAGTPGSDQAQVDVAPVQHITRYVLLQPGETPPPGATVMDPSQAAAAVAATNAPSTSATARPTAKPTPQPTPKPKRKVTRTRQSGQP